MKTIAIELPDIPHGHGLSFKKGIADGLLDNRDHEDSPHSTHSASYQRGFDIGAELKQQIAALVKP